MVDKNYATQSWVIRKLEALRREMKWGISGTTTTTGGSTPTKIGWRDLDNLYVLTMAEYNALPESERNNPNNLYLIER